MTTKNAPIAPRTAAWLTLVAAFVLGGCAAPGGPVSSVAVGATTTAIPPAAMATAAPEAAAAAIAPEQASAAGVTAAVDTPPGGPAAGLPVDPLRPETVVLPDDPSAHDDLWTRVRQGFVMPNLDDNYVRRQEQWYASRPDYVQRMTERSSRFLFHIVEEVSKRGMPTELALLPFIESAFNPQALSVAKASGMWQFVPATGKTFDLKQNVFRDDRRSVLDSTRAALDYLSKLHDMFGDWHLALAAYNWGEGNVQRAIARNQKKGLPTDYASLRMPDETRNYVPKLQAVKNIVLRPETFGLALSTLSNHPYFLSVPIERDIDVNLAAKLAGLPVDDFKQLNPQMNKPIILAAGTPRLLLPYDNANAFVRNLGEYRGPLASWTAWVTPKTLKPDAAAKQVGMTTAMFCEVNHVPARALIKAGSTLVVPRGEHVVENVSEAIADNAIITLAHEASSPRRVAFKAGKKGDSVASVARRYRVSTSQVAQWNQVGAGASFQPGQSIIVFTSAPAKKAVHTASAGASRKAIKHVRTRSRVVAER